MQDLKAQFDRDGFVVVPDFLNQTEITAALDDAYAVIDGVEPIPNPEERDFFRVFSLRTKEPMNLDRPGLTAIGDKPELLDLARLIISDDAVYSHRLMQVYLPHAGHKQSWHTDSEPDYEPFHYVTFLTYFQDQTPQTGMTRVVPGSHRFPIEKRFPDHVDLPGQVAVAAPAGTLCAFRSTIWHSGTENLSDKPRFALGFRYSPAKYVGDSAWHWHDRNRHARGMRRPGKPIFDHPTEEGSYEWPEAYEMSELPYLN